MDKDVLKKCLDEIKVDDKQIIPAVSTTLTFSDNVGLTTSYLTMVVELMHLILKKYASYKASDPEYSQWLLKCFDDGRNSLIKISSHKKMKNQKLISFKALIEFLPLYLDSTMEKPSFPNEEYGKIMNIIVSSESPAPFLNILKEYVIHEDMSINLWKAIDLATEGRDLSAAEVKNVLSIMELIVTKKNQETPTFYLCGVKIGILRGKKLNECVKRIWERLMAVEVPLRTRQMLLLSLLEKMMPNMNKPVFLIDYFMICLDYGGAVALLSLQGIFELIHKHNLNYPNIYTKLYEMFNSNMFETSYKSRFYYLSDIFLTSTHLPEALVAGFAKRFSRLCLVAPPPDIIILMAFIVNLIIRHPGLNVLMTNMTKWNRDSDPYLADEKNPEASRALESGLWEVLFLQNHVLPQVSSAASFLNKPIPSIEIDISGLLDVTMEEMFTKELNRKTKEMPLTFEKPTLEYLSLESNQLGLAFWDFSQ